MLAVRAPADKTEALLGELDDSAQVVVANQNAPDQSVISGPLALLSDVRRALKKEGLSVREIPVSCAFHSPMVKPGVSLFAKALADISLQTTQEVVYSNTSAKPYANDAQSMRRQLAQHIASPVRFVDQIEAMYEAGARIFVEVGPGRILTGLAGKILKGKPHQVVPTHEVGRQGIPTLLKALAALAVSQVEFDVEALFDRRSTTPFALEQPPVRSKSCWQIDGHRAWPVVGPLPDFAMQPITEPVVVSQPNPAAGQLSNRDSVVLEYLQGMREMIRSQSQVLLQYLGANPQTVTAEVQPVAAVVATPQIASVQPVVAQPQPAPAQPEQLDVGGTLMQIVSERTGYPIDMLDPKLDLAADLSIDSIKRIEILGELSKRLDLGQQQVGNQDEVIEELASQKTLQAIISWIEERIAVPDRIQPDCRAVQQPGAGSDAGIVGNRLRPDRLPHRDAGFGFGPGGRSVDRLD